MSSVNNVYKAEGQHSHTWSRQRPIGSLGFPNESSRDGSDWMLRDLWRFRLKEAPFWLFYHTHTKTYRHTCTHSLLVIASTQQSVEKGRFCSRFISPTSSSWCVCACACTWVWVGARVCIRVDLADNLMANGVHLQQCPDSR